MGFVLVLCGARLRQSTGIGAYGCGNGPEGGQVYPCGIAFGGDPGWNSCCFGLSGCGGFGGWDN